jgi:hypothetical protein
MLKKLLYAGAAAFMLLCTCQNEDKNLPVPSDLTNVRVYPRVGGITVKWDYPEDSTKTLLVQVRYVKNGRTITSNASLFSDSVAITGLINKLDYTFEVQPFNANMVGGKTIISPVTKPIKRPTVVTYDSDKKTPVVLKADMLDTYTQDPEGPKENLIDGNISTFWHTAWDESVSVVAPLPHWVQINFQEPAKIGGIRYFFRQNGDESSRPNKWDLQTSTDGVSWVTVWKSKDNLPTAPQNKEQILPFDKNYQSKFFRIRIVGTQAMDVYTHLSELAVYFMAERFTDLEAEAEAKYK